MTTPAPTPVLGIDISKLNFDAALLDTSSDKSSDKGGGRPRHKAFPNTPQGFERLAEWLADALGEQKVHACLEATGAYGDALARALHERGHTVSVVNPARIKGFGQARMSRTKTDKADAILIAHFCALHRPEPWRPPAPEQSQLQALVRRLESLQEMRQMEKNRLDTGDAFVREEIQEHVTYLDTQIERTERRIRDHVGGSPTLSRQSELLDSIPGVGPATAAALLAELGDVSQFTGARQVAAFAGLVPRIRQSGQWKGHVRLSKCGTGRLRHALYFPALSALRSSPVLERRCGAGYSWRASPLTPPSAPPSSPSRKGAKRSSKNSRPPLDKQHSI